MIKSLTFLCAWLLLFSLSLKKNNKQEKIIKKKTKMNQKEFENHE